MSLEHYKIVQQTKIAKNVFKKGHSRSTVKNWAQKLSFDYY